MGNIHVLSFEMANLIAAGEVVDRPASVLKELLENAIDAGATRITAQIRGGGVSMIRVSDNGCGMTAEDLPVAIRRHATSKIRTAEDLSGIATLGFRGEALAAIAAVSELRILTKTKEAESGVMLTSVGGRVTDISEVGATDGTTVIVENLFENVPARRKFLKKDATETMAASAVIEKIAISRPDISFEWITDDNTRFRTAGDGQLKNTLYAILGRDFANRLLAVEGGVGAVRVTGFVGAPDNVRNNRNHQNVFINGRYVKSKTVMAALEKACTSYVASERFPVCALFLEILPAAVDVNVHPAKLEVKFSDERAVFEAVYYAVRSAFEKNVTRPELALRTGAGQGRGATPSPFSDARAIPATQLTADAQIRGANPHLTTHAPTERGTYPPMPSPQGKAGTYVAGGTVTAKKALENLRAFRADAAEVGAAPAPQGRGTLAADPLALREESAALAEEEKWSRRTDINGPVCRENEASMPPPKEGGCDAPTKAGESTGDTPGDSPAPVYRIIGEAFHCYVLVEVGEELLLIDKHAAHERILFEELLAEQRRDGRVASQSLIVPLAVPLDDHELAAAAEYREEIEAVGFSYILVPAARHARITAVPGAIALPSAEELFTRMTAELAEGAGNPAITEAVRLEKTLYQVACKAAIKGGRAYGEAQIAWLVSRVMALPDVTVCPHGRPIAIRLTKHHLDRQFDRIN